MQESYLKQLPSYEFYKKLNETKVNDISEYCKEISKNLPQKDNIQKICTLLITNLFLLRDKHYEDTSFFNKHCYDLNYWLYEQLSALLNGNTQNTEPYSVIEEIHGSWKKVVQNEILDNTDNRCMPEQKFYEKKLIKLLKDLFDYAENYKTIENEITKSSEEAKKYCSYILGKVPLYFMSKELCSSGESDRCTTYIGNYEEYNPSALLSQLSCLGGEIGNIPLDKDLINEVLKLQQSIPNLMIPDLSQQTNLQGAFMKSLEGLMKNGFASIGIESLFNAFPSLSAILNSDVFKQYVMPSLYGTGSLILFFILYKCKSSFFGFNMFHGRSRRSKLLRNMDPTELMGGALGLPSPMMPINPYGLRYQPM
ncbi:VIR protein [Plasmodium vivax]|uniref:PIR protein n=1 Tax=Plasmodium vivax TaxID=5855 RepID=A0A1G4HA22_PLAVI|nr:VIR protein [Plasmodium vivax]VUZ94577.1 PIR protein [Plasmodium vivax]